MRIIDADAILCKMESVMDMQDVYLPVHFMEMVIDDMPTIEAETVRYGKWIASESNKPTKLFSCSECKGVFELGHYAYKCYYNYCPNCGAKMEGNDESEIL